MFRPVRKKKNELDLESVRKLLVTERRGVLAVNGEDGYPYAVPINYIYCQEDNKIYFHGARVGYKADMLKKDGKVCFTVYGNERIKGEAWAPYMQSAVIFGECRLICDHDRTIELVRKFAGKYYPNDELIEKEITASGRAVQMFEIDIKHVSGKEIQER